MCAWTSNWLQHFGQCESTALVLSPDSEVLSPGLYTSIQMVPGEMKGCVERWGKQENTYKTGGTLNLRFVTLFRRCFLKTGVGQLYKSLLICLSMIVWEDGCMSVSLSLNTFLFLHICIDPHVYLCRYFSLFVICFY